MPKESIFGTPADPVSRGGSDDMPSWLKDETPTTEPSADASAEGTPAEPAAPEATPEAATDETQPASTPQQDLIVQLTPEEFAQFEAAQKAATEQATEGATQEELTQAAERLYANKYKTSEDLEKGYRERTDQWRRAVERAKAEEADRIRAEQERSQYEQALRSAIPMLEQAAAQERAMRTYAEQYRQQYGEYPQGLTPAPSPQGQPGMTQADVQRMLEDRLAVERGKMQEDFARQAEAAALEKTVLSFYQDHQEVEPWGALDNEITDAMATLNESPAWEGARNSAGGFGIVVDPTDRGSLDVLYEAVSRPALLEVFRLKPDYFTSEAGLALARRDAAILEGVPATTAPTTATVPASRAGTRAGQKIPFAESAQGSVPQNQGPDQTDVWERIKAVDSGAKRGKGSPFFE